MRVRGRLEVACRASRELVPTASGFSVGLSGAFAILSLVSRRCPSVSSCCSASSLVFPFVEELTLRVCIVVNDF